MRVVNHAQSVSFWKLLIASTLGGVVGCAIVVGLLIAALRMAQ